MKKLECPSRAAMETMSPDPTAYIRRRFSVDEYYRMVDAGILAENDRVELLDGAVVVREPPRPPHAGRVMRLTDLFSRRLRDRAIVNAQNPLHVDEFDEPEPDIALLKPRDDFYASAHPKPDDVLLLIEVALTSVHADHRVKVPLYARAGVREFWIVNIPDDLLEVYRRPSEKGYRRIARLARESTVSPESFQDVQIDVGEILG